MGNNLFKKEIKTSNGATVNLKWEDEGFGGWATGSACVKTKNGESFDFIFECKHFEEGSRFGIKNGRISKLGIRYKSPSRAIAEYDRGWCLTFDRYKQAINAVYAAILTEFN